MDQSLKPTHGPFHHRPCVGVQGGLQAPHEDKALMKKSAQTSVTGHPSLEFPSIQLPPQRKPLTKACVDRGMLGWKDV